MSEYKGIPVIEDDTLREDEIVIQGTDKEGRPLVMRFRRCAVTGKMKAVGQ